MLELKGKPVADFIYAGIQNQLKNWPQLGWRNPHLAVVLVGDDPASQVYVQHKQRACEQLQFKSTLIKLSAAISEKELTQQLAQLNNDDQIDAILLQLPLPAHLNSRKMSDLISLSKDADALTSAALGKLVAGENLVSSCTPAGIIEILDFYRLDVAQKNVLVIGRSLIVGIPLFHLLNQKNATVTLAHSKTQNLKNLVKQFDFVFVAVGKPYFLKAEDFKKEAVVIDVGIHRMDKGLIGDVDPTGYENYLKALTPVPKGVGPMTIAMLMKNTLLLSQKHREYKIN